MKYTIVLIATVFLIGLTGSDAQDGKDKKEESKKDGGNKKPASGAKKTEDAAKKPAKKEAEKSTKEEPKKKKDDKKVEEEPKKAEEEENADAQEDDSGSEDDDKGAEEEEEEEEETPPPPPKKQKSATGKKAAPAKQPSSKTPTRKPSKKKADEDEESDEDLLNRLTKLKDNAESVNPASLVTALGKTPTDVLKKAAPLMKRLMNIFDGTPMKDFFNNLFALTNAGDKQTMGLLIGLFPNLLMTAATTAGKLGAVALSSAGRLGKSFVELGDAIFDGGKDVFEELADSIPYGSPFFDTAKQGLNLLHVAAMSPPDAIATALRKSGKTMSKEMQRFNSRMRP